MNAHLPALALTVLVAASLATLEACSTPGADAVDPLPTSDNRAISRATEDAGFPPLEPGTPADLPDGAGGQPASPCDGASDGAAPWMCDGFEAPTLDARWSLSPTPADGGSAGALTLRTKQHHGGRQSLSVAFPTLPERGSAMLSLEGPARGRPRAGIRAWLYVPVDGYPDELVVASVHAGPSDDASLVLLHGQQIMLRARVGSETRSTGVGPVATGAWTCLRLDVDTAAGRTAAEVGAARVTDFVSSTSPVASLEIGLAYQGAANANASVNVFFDDVEMADHAAGCVAP